MSDGAGSWSGGWTVQTASGWNTEDEKEDEGASFLKHLDEGFIAKWPDWTDAVQAEKNAEGPRNMNSCWRD